MALPLVDSERLTITEGLVEAPSSRKSKPCRVFQSLTSAMVTSESRSGWCRGVKERGTRNIICKKKRDKKMFLAILQGSRTSRVMLVLQSLIQKGGL